MMHIAAILRTHYTNEILDMLIDYDTAYRSHRQLVRDARALRKKNTALPISMLADGIAGKLQIIRNTQELMQVISTLPAIKGSQHWHCRHLFKKYRMGVMSENTQVRLCADLSAKLKNLPSIKNEGEIQC